MPDSAMQDSRKALASKARRRWARTAVASAVALVVAGCTILGSRDIVQCRTTSDCASSPLPNAVCSDGLCVSAAATPDVGADSNGEAPACTRTDDCKEKEAVCVDQRCVKLTDPTLCPFLEPAGVAYQTKDVTFVGVYANIGQVVNAEPGVGAVRLALKEINDPSVSVVAVLCSKEAKRAGDVVKHLASRKVPVVFGQFESSDVGTLSDFAGQNGIALWSTLGNTSQVEKLDSKGHVAFFLDELASTAPAFQEAFRRAETKTNPLLDANDQDAGRAEETRVAMFVGAAPEAVALADKLTATSGGLTVNGKALAESGASTFRRYQLPQAALTEIWETYRPHVIVGVGGDEVMAATKTVEASMGAAPRAAYVLSSQSKYNVVDLQTVFSASRDRVIGVDFSGDAAKHQSYTATLAPNGILRAATSYDILYDATYVAALASLAPRPAGAGPLTADDLIHGLDLFRGADSDPASDIDVGPADKIASGRTLLRAGKHVRFHGVTGAWNFAKDVATRRMETSLFCFQKGGTGDLAYYVDPAAPSPCEL
jgi:hypothetical protein